MKQSRTISGTVESAPLPPPSVGVIPPYPISTAHPDWPTLLKYATQTANGTNNFGYTINDVAQTWAATGRTNTAMRDWCVTTFRTKLAAALVKWNAGQRLTEFDGDSYLEAGNNVGNWCVCLNWFGDVLTVQEKSDALMILNQCVFNIWNYTKANWNGKAYPWSGWATNNPLNNYFYRSFLKATTWLAIHTQSQSLIDYIKTTLVPMIRAAYAALVGGGSLEGTGYGSAYSSLFQAIWMLKNGLGIDLTTDIRTTDHLDYWCAVTTPDYLSFAGIGDQSRTSYPAVWDYQKAIVVWGIMLVPDTASAARARTWVAKTGGARPERPENCWMLCYNTSGPTATLNMPSYLAEGTGHLFAYDADGQMVSIEGGTAAESHDAMAKGEVQIYFSGATGKKWKFATANIFSQSGIMQATSTRNCSLYRNSAGAVILQQRSYAKRVALNHSDVGGLLDCTMDLSQIYANTNVVAPMRRVTWDRAAKTVRIADSQALKNGATATFRLTSSSQPTVNADGSITCDVFTVRCLTPGVVAKITYWPTISTDFTPTATAWLIEWSGSDIGYTVEISR